MPTISNTTNTNQFPAARGGVSPEAVFTLVSLIEFELAQLEGKRISSQNDELQKVHDRKKKMIELQNAIKKMAASTSSSEGVGELTAGEVREIERLAKEVGVDLSGILEPIKQQMLRDYLKPAGGNLATDAGAKWDFDGDGVIGELDIEYNEWREATEAGQAPDPNSRFSASSFEDLPDHANHWLDFADNTKLTEERRGRITEMNTTIDKSIDLAGDDQSTLSFNLRKSFNVYSTRLEQANELQKRIHQVNEKLLS